ncbi:MAG: cytochrome c biogenesis protein CcsA [Anaerolineae bacterium]|nr:cytochrome c biogenesis protein CcsA [Anaerolineae bacterium]
MSAEVGSLSLILALAASLYAALALARGAHRLDRRWLASGRNALHTATALLGLALGLLTLAFLTDTFQVAYVYRHSSLELPLYLKVTAVWAGQEGSLLVWSFLQALFAALVVRSLPNRSGPLVPWAGVFLGAIVAFFVGVTTFLSSPFALLPSVPPNGQGMSPLLRHPGMVFHPPALYVGYVALAIPFSLAMAGLITGRVAEWPVSARRWTLAAWLFLGLGIFLGARWAYDVLGWGGYWGWDPVENAALMPWLVATALLHGSVIQQERGTFRTWNLMLAVLSFLFVLFGTFATRSGLIESVHAFARSNLGYYFLAFMALVVALALYLGLRARRQLASTPAKSAGLLSREGMFFLTLVVLSTITASVFVGSVFPTLSQALSGQRMEAGPEWFDRVTGPQFGALVLLMGVCPLVGYAVSTFRRLGRRAAVPLTGAVLVVLAAVLLGFTDAGSLVGFAAVGLAGATTLGQFWPALASRPEGEGAISHALQVWGRHRRRYGGYLVHTGVILMAVGVIGTRMHSSEGQLTLNSGAPRSFGNYTFVYEEARQENRADHTALTGTFDVYRDGAYLITLAPQLHFYPGAGQTIAIPALKVGLREDLYLVLGGVSADGTSATLRVVVDPLINFLWLGGLVFMAGGVIALWPPSPAREASPALARRRALIGTVALVVGVGVFAAAAAIMWGGGQGSVSRASGRPLPGQAAPGFFLRSLDGEDIGLAGMAGNVVVVNFWATWCQPCEDELPALQSLWEEFGPRGVRFVGLAYRETEGAVRAAAQRFGLTFPLALDVNNAVAASYGITGIPETFVVDRQGRVAYVHIGPITSEQLAQELESVLAEEAP